MFDDSIFKLFFNLIEEFFCEVLQSRILGKNKTILFRIISALTILLSAGIFIIAVVVAGIALIFVIDFSSNLFQSVITIVLALSTIIGIICLLIVLPKHLLEFESFKDEMDFSNRKGISNHTVLLILQQTKKDCFVLAHFDGYIGIRPAVYKMHGKRIGLLNIYKENIYYKDINLCNFEDKESNNIRVCRIKDRVTKTQMIVFASKNSNLDININNIVIPKIDSKDSIGDFSIYGTVETSKMKNSDTVTINGYKYKLNKCKSSKFIGKNEITKTKQNI